MDKGFESLPDILRARDVAKFLSIGIGKAYEIMRSNQIRSFRVGRCLRTTKKALREYVDGKVA